MEGMLTYCPDSSCSTKHLVAGEQIECGAYTTENSRKMLHDMERQSAILQSGIIAIQSDIMDGQLITQEEVNGFQLSSPATGGPGKFECGRRPKAVTVSQRKWYWETINLSCHADLCLKTFIPTTWKRFLTSREYREVWKNSGGINAYLSQFAIDQISAQLSDLVINGDYKGKRSEVAHFDGIRKLVWNAYGEGANEVVKFNLTGALAAGDFVTVRVGAHFELIPFNTDAATTLADVVAFLSECRSDVTGEPVYTVSHNGVDCIYVTANHNGWQVDVSIWATDASGYDWKCDSFTPAASGAVFTEEVVQQVKDAYSPMKMPYVVPTKTNVQDILCELALAIANIADDHQKCRLPGLGRLRAEDYVVIISPQFASLIGISQALIKQCCSGTVVAPNAPDSRPRGLGQQMGFFTSAFGLNFYIDPYMKGYEYIATPRGNFEYGTDRLNSLQNVETHYDFDCQLWKYTHEGLAALHVLKPELIVSNIPCAPGAQYFSDPMPAVVNPRPCIEQLCSIDGILSDGQEGCAPLSYSLEIVENAADWTVTASNASLAAGTGYWVLTLSDGTEVITDADNPVFTIAKDLMGTLLYRENFGTLAAPDFGACDPKIVSIDSETGNFEVNGERVEQTNL